MRYKAVRTKKQYLNSEPQPDTKQNGIVQNKKNFIERIVLNLALFYSLMCKWHGYKKFKA